MSKFMFIEPKRHALALEICRATGIDADKVSRLVIDLKIGDAGKLYVETFADNAILDVSIGELGVSVTE